MTFSFKNNKDKQKGFTILELLISLSIFALMSALLLSKYGTFNQGVLLTNLAYDVALTIRNAQSYGLNVKSSDRLANSFENAYGVHFNIANPDRFILFVDSNNNGIYDDSGIEDRTSDQMTIIKRGSKINLLCSTENCNATSNTLDITFKRPDPNAIMVFDGTTPVTPAPYAEISILSTDGGIKKIVVNSTGQISVK